MSPPSVRRKTSRKRKQQPIKAIGKARRAKSLIASQRSRHSPERVNGRHRPLALFFIQWKQMLRSVVLGRAFGRALPSRVRQARRRPCPLLLVPTGRMERHMRRSFGLNVPPSPGNGCAGGGTFAKRLSRRSPARQGRRQPSIPRRRSRQHFAGVSTYLKTRVYPPATRGQFGLRHVIHGSSPPRPRTAVTMPMPSAWTASPRSRESS